MKGMEDSEYEACIKNLGLLEGEQVKLQYVCCKEVISSPSIWDGQRRNELKKGLLVFTNDNVIFMQQESKSSYAQALRLPLEHISGVVTGGTINKHITISAGVSGTSEQHTFSAFPSTHGENAQQIHEIRADIEKLLKDSREEKKRLAQEALSKGTMPTMIFCKFCGARNKSDQQKCSNCGALLN